MDNKRKANQSAGSGAADGDDRAAKRRKIPPSTQHYNLFDGESKESTTQYGLQFLEQIRRTGDKSGRRVAGYFEKLIPREGNEDYYKRTRMPISLETIEEKLYNRDFNDMAELESYAKRMIQNAKDYYPRHSQVFDDAERVRKALSNYMVKTNPAYKLVHGYSAVPTPIPEELEATPSPNGEAEAEADEEEEEDAEGDEEEGEGEGEGEGEDEDAEGEEEEDGDDENQESETDADEPAVVARRRGPGRPPKNPALHAQKMAERQSSGGPRADQQYDNVPYKGLTFQQAQEKIVEELIRKPDADDETYAYFEPFHNLPPRSLKDYYQVIKEPLSLRKLQKLVKGIHGRGERTGQTEYKSWAAFEEKASLLWQNAYYYNEDGSDIANMAKELEQFFNEQLKEAKAAVQEPAQPKIKIKMGQDSAVAGPKKITIHVANNNGRGSSAESPAPQTAGSASSDGAPNGGARATRNPFGGSSAAVPIGLAQLDKARSMSGSAASPSPSVGMKREDVARGSPAVLPRPNGPAVVAAAPPNPSNVPVPMYNGNAFPGAPLQNGHAPVSVAPPTLPYDNKFRPPGRGIADALLGNLTIRTHPGLTNDRRFVFRLPPHPKEAQQSVTINIPTNHWKQQVIVTLSPMIHEQQRPFKLFVIVNGATVGPAIPAPNDPIDHGGKLYEASLHPGVNTIQVQVIAALPKGQKLPNGSEVEFEKITVLANMARY